MRHSHFSLDTARAFRLHLSSRDVIGRSRCAWIVAVGVLRPCCARRARCSCLMPWGVLVFYAAGLDTSMIASQYWEGLATRAIRYI